jgi:hypothetical protein
MPASVDEIRFDSASLSIHHACDVFFAVTRAAVEEVGGPHAQISLTVKRFHGQLRLTVQRFHQSRVNALYWTG